MLHKFDFIRFECKPEWGKKSEKMLIKGKPVSPRWMITNNASAEISAFWQGLRILLDRKHCPLEILNRMLSGFFLSELYTYRLSVSSEVVWLKAFKTAFSLFLHVFVFSDALFALLGVAFTYEELSLKGTHPVVETCQSKLHQCFGGFGLCPTFTH